MSGLPPEQDLTQAAVTVIRLFEPVTASAERWRCDSALPPCVVLATRLAARTTPTLPARQGACPPPRCLTWPWRQVPPDASLEVPAPSAFAGHAALSGAAGIRTLPLRRCFRPHRPVHTPSGLGSAGRISPLRFSAAPPARAPRWMLIEAGCRSPQVMHRRCIPADVPLPHLASCVAWPGLHGPATLLGFDPSQCCSCPRAQPGVRLSSFPTCRSSRPPPRSFSSRDRPSVFTSLVPEAFATADHRRSGPGFWV